MSDPFTYELEKAKDLLATMGAVEGKPVYISFPRFIIHPKIHFVRFMIFSSVPSLIHHESLTYEQALEIVYQMLRVNSTDSRHQFIIEPNGHSIWFKVRRGQIVDENDQREKVQSWVGRAVEIDGEIFYNCLMVEQPMVTMDMVKSEILQMDWTHDDDDPLYLAVATARNGSVYTASLCRENMNFHFTKRHKDMLVNDIHAQVNNALINHYRSVALTEALRKLQNVNTLIAKPLFQPHDEL
jgi:hypothetical protein